MNTQSLSNILATLAPNSGFAIYGDVLNENDYNSNVVFNDSGKRGEWETYRQELRDITTQPDPFNITWPSIPS